MRDFETLLRLRRARGMARVLRIVPFPYPRTDAALVQRRAVSRRLAWLRSFDGRYRQAYWAFDCRLGYDLSNVRALFPAEVRRQDDELDDIPF